MLSQERTKAIAAIHDSSFMAVIVITGGGTRVLADLTSVPGASRTILEGLIPYCGESLAEFLAEPPAQAVSVETAARLAERAFERATGLRPDEGTPVMGVGCTAALATDRPRKGTHRIHVSIREKRAARVYSLTLVKGARTREAEERVAADLVLCAVAQACGVPFSSELGLLPEEEVCVSKIPMRNG